MRRTVLAVVAHPDDEVLGLGATLAHHAANDERVVVAIAADHGREALDEPAQERVRSSAREAARRLGIESPRFGGRLDQRLDTYPILEITHWVLTLLRQLQPQLVYTHHRGDVNRDHRVVHEATLTAARPYAAPFVEQILCFETPSSTEWSGPYTENAFLPNWWVDVATTLDTKLHALAAYETELRPAPHPRSPEALRARAAYWGSQVGSPAAEAFMLVRALHRQGSP